MATLHETIETSLARDEAFAFVADFANAAQWDPGVIASARLDDGPIGIGSRYQLLVRMGGRTAPMTYAVTAWEPGRRVVLAGTGPGVRALDEIRFESLPAGTRVDYTADIRLTGWMRLLSPFARGAFGRIARNAREGLAGELGRRAAGA